MAPTVLSNAHKSVRRRNILALAAMEVDEKRKRTTGERLADCIAASAQSLGFFGVHVVWFAVWIGWNVGVVAWVKPFDPYPFSFLTLVVSLEAIFLSLFILMSQAREMRHSDQRAKLDLQINLLAEHETTKLLELVRELCRVHKLPIADDPELAELIEHTNPEALMDEVKHADHTANRR